MADETSKGDRIAKVLARAGIASRRDSEKLITAGRVKVNGQKILSPALNVHPYDKIEFDDNLIEAAEEARLWLYNKPAGLVTSARDEKGRETVFDNLPDHLPRVMSVGRLDLNSGRSAFADKRRCFKADNGIAQYRLDPTLPCAY